MPLQPYKNMFQKATNTFLQATFNLLQSLVFDNDDDQDQDKRPGNIGDISLFQAPVTSILQ